MADHGKRLVVKCAVSYLRVNESISGVPGNNRTERMSLRPTVPRRMPVFSCRWWMALAHRPTLSYCREIEYDHCGGSYASDDNRDERQSRTSWLQVRRKPLTCAPRVRRNDDGVSHRDRQSRPGQRSGGQTMGRANSAFS